MGIQEVRDGFRGRVDDALETGRHTIIERRNRPVAVLVPYRWYERITRATSPDEDKPAELRAHYDNNSTADQMDGGTWLPADDDARLAEWQQRWDAMTPEQQAAEIRMMDEHAASQPVENRRGESAYGDGTPSYPGDPGREHENPEDFPTEETA